MWNLYTERFPLECEADEIICEGSIIVFSVDAFIRTMLDGEAYHGVVAIGGTLPAVGYGKVIKAGSAAKYKPGSRHTQFPLKSNSLLCQTLSLRA